MPCRRGGGWWRPLACSFPHLAPAWSDGPGPCGMASAPSQGTCSQAGQARALQPPVACHLSRRQMRERQSQPAGFAICHHPSLQQIFCRGARPAQPSPAQRGALDTNNRSVNQSISQSMLPVRTGSPSGRRNSRFSLLKRRRRHNHHHGGAGPLHAPSPPRPPRPLSRTGSHRTVSRSAPPPYSTLESSTSASLIRTHWRPWPVRPPDRHRPHPVVSPSCRRAVRTFHSCLHHGSRWWLDARRTRPIDACPWRGVSHDSVGRSG